MSYKPERDREYFRRYREANRERLKAWREARRAADPEKKKAADRAYYEANRDTRIAYQKAYRASAHGKERRRARAYGLTVEQLRAVVAPGRCAICGGRSKLHIDHCHATGVVRGLLCADCNRGLGSFRDRPDLLRRAAGYVTPSTPQIASERT